MPSPLFHNIAGKVNPTNAAILLQYRGFDWWIGVSDKLVEGAWTLNSTGRPIPYSNWDGPEPNGGTGENCALFYSGSGRWADFSCNLAYWAMCEKVVQIKSKGEPIITLIC